MVASPLSRARETAEIVMQGRDGVAVEHLKVLREIDLYSFQVRLGCVNQGLGT